MQFCVRLTPRGGRDAIEGWLEPPPVGGDRYLRIRVSAPPEGGKANAALIALLAQTLGCPKSSLRIVAGATSRIKRLEAPASVGSILRTL